MSRVYRRSGHAQRVPPALRDIPAGKLTPVATLTLVAIGHQEFYPAGIVTFPLSRSL